MGLLAFRIACTAFVGAVTTGRSGGPCWPHYGLQHCAHLFKAPEAGRCSLLGCTLVRAALWFVASLRFALVAPPPDPVGFPPWFPAILVAITGQQPGLLPQLPQGYTYNRSHRCVVQAVFRLLKTSTYTMIWCRRAPWYMGVGYQGAQKGPYTGLGRGLSGWRRARGHCRRSGLGNGCICLVGFGSQACYAVS